VCLLAPQRWRHVAHDRRLWLVVSSRADGAAAAEEESERCDDDAAAVPRLWGTPRANCHATLAAAVAASAPGQSIWVERGAHACADIHVRYDCGRSLACAHPLTRLRMLLHTR
jgi:hypothetical protein